MELDVCRVAILTSVDDVIVIKDVFEDGEWLGAELRIHTADGSTAKTMLDEEDLLRMLTAMEKILEEEFISLDVVRSVLHEKFGKEGENLIKKMRVEEARRREWVMLNGLGVEEGEGG